MQSLQVMGVCRPYSCRMGWICGREVLYYGKICLRHAYRFGALSLTYQVHIRLVHACCCTCMNSGEPPDTVTLKTNHDRLGNADQARRSEQRLGKIKHIPDNQWGRLI